MEKIKIKSLRLLRGILLLFTFTSLLNAQDFMMQGWYWNYPKTANGFLWADTIKNKAVELKNAGFTYIWLPPLSRASFGSSSNGYDPKDLYDLGEFGQGATGFGTRSNVDALITQFNNVGMKAVADVVYNHRDGGRTENNSALRNYINAYDWTRANTGYNPFPYDRFRVILPIGGATGNGAGDYYFKVSSVSGHNRFKHSQYNVYMQTNRKGWQNLAPLIEVEPNGGSDCGQGNNSIQLGRDMNSVVDDPVTCRTDEFYLSLSASDYFSSGDTIFIYFGKRNSDYSDVRVYGIWSSPRGQDISSEIIYQTYTNFTNMPSGLGAMNFENFKPNSTNSTKLDGDWDWLLFFYDYDQNVPATKTALFNWTRWLWNNVGIRGLRMDAVKHFPPEFVGDLLDNLHSNGIDPGMIVGEFFDTNPLLLKNWVTDVYAYMDNSTKLSITPRVFDFSLRDTLKKASDQFGFDVRNVFNAGVVDAQGLSGTNAVTFVNNHDYRDPGQAIDNDPILAYVYLLTNNQVGLPCIFYPDYYSVSGFPNGGLKQKIDRLISVHRQHIFGSTAREYLTRFGTPYNPFFNSSGASTTLAYQLRNTPSGNDVIVAINYSGEPLDMWVGLNLTGIAEGTTFGDQIGNSLLQTLTVSGGRVNIKLPARSYAVWVEGQPPMINSSTLNLTAVIEGFYNSSVMKSDTVTAEIRSSTSYELVESKKVVLNTSGQGTVTYLSLSNGVNYYIAIKHRNSIETWSKLPQKFTGGTLDYDFTTAATQAFGENMNLKGTKWCIINGDCNQDGFIDGSDYLEIVNNWETDDPAMAGDTNGDQYIDGSDFLQIANNWEAGAITPLSLLMTIRSNIQPTLGKEE